MIFILLSAWRGGGGGTIRCPCLSPQLAFLCNLYELHTPIILILLYLIAVIVLRIGQEYEKWSYLSFIFFILLLHTVLYTKFFHPVSEAWSIRFKITKNTLYVKHNEFYYIKRLHVSTLEAGHHQAHVQIKSSDAVLDGIPSCTHL